MPTICIHRHPQCNRRARYARLHRRLDWLGRVEDATQSPYDRPLRRGEMVMRDLRSGALHGGAAGMALLARQVPAYWPLPPLFWLSPVRRAIDADVAGNCGNACSMA